MDFAGVKFISKLPEPHSHKTQDEKLIDSPQLHLPAEDATAGSRTSCVNFKGCSHHHGISFTDMAPLLHTLGL